jgi:hypothetical protein
MGSQTKGGLQGKYYAQSEQLLRLVQPTRPTVGKRHRTARAVPLRFAFDLERGLRKGDGAD